MYKFDIQHYTEECKIAKKSESLILALSKALGKDKTQIIGAYFEAAKRTKWMQGDRGITLTERLFKSEIYSEGHLIRICDIFNLRPASILSETHLFIPGKKLIVFSSQLRKSFYPPFYYGLLEISDKEARDLSPKINHTLYIPKSIPINMMKQIIEGGFFTPVLSFVEQGVEDEELVS